MGWICLFVALATCVWAVLNRRPWWGWIVAGSVLLLRAVLEGQAGDPLFIAGLFAYLGGCVLPTFPPWSRSLLDPEQGQGLHMEEVFDAIEQLRSQAPQLWSEARTQTGQLLDQTGRAARTVAKAGAKLWVERLQSEKDEASGEPLDPFVQEDLGGSNGQAEVQADLATASPESFADYEDFADFLEVEFSDEPALSFESDPFLQDGDGWIEADLSGLAEEIEQAGEQPSGAEPSSFEIAAALDGLAAWDEFASGTEPEAELTAPAELSTIEDEMSDLLGELEAWDPHGDSPASQGAEVAELDETIDLTAEVETWDPEQPDPLAELLEVLDSGPEPRPDELPSVEFEDSASAPDAPIPEEAAALDPFADLAAEGLELFEQLEDSEPTLTTAPPPLAESQSVESAGPLGLTAQEPLASELQAPPPAPESPAASEVFDPWPLVSWDLPLALEPSESSHAAAQPEESAPAVLEQSQVGIETNGEAAALVREPSLDFEGLPDDLVSDDLAALEREVGEWLVESPQPPSAPPPAGASAPEHIPDLYAGELYPTLSDEAADEAEDEPEEATRAEEVGLDTNTVPLTAPLELAAPFDETAGIADEVETEQPASPLEAPRRSAIEFEVALVDTGLPGSEGDHTIPPEASQASQEEGPPPAPNEDHDLDAPHPPFPTRSRPRGPSLVGLFGNEEAGDLPAEGLPGNSEASGVECAPWVPPEAELERAEDDELTFGPAIGPLDLPSEPESFGAEDGSGPPSSGEPEAPFGRSAPSEPSAGPAWRAGGPQTPLPPLGPFQGPLGPSTPFQSSASRSGSAPGFGTPLGPKTAPEGPSSGLSVPPTDLGLILPDPAQATVALPGSAGLPGQPLVPGKLRSLEPSSGLRKQPAGPIENLVSGGLTGRASGPLHAELLTLAWELARRHPRLLADPAALREALSERAESLSPAARRFLERLSTRDVADLARLLP